MGPPGWRFASYGTTPAWRRDLPVVEPLYWPDELPVSVIEIVEMLWLWLQGLGLREVARLAGTDRKTVRRYVDRARACGLDRDGGEWALTPRVGHA
jgi:hypothetical protein